MRRLSIDIYGAIQYDFNAAPVDNAYDKLHTKWDKHREEMLTTMDRIADTLRAIRKAWEAVDQEMAARLGPGGTE